MLPPGSTIGILGGGQLGRMLGIAAAQLGYRTQILAPDRQSVAAQTASSLTRADYHNRIVLADFAEACDVVTYEFENVAIAPVEWLATRIPVHPHPRALAVAQDRVAEKSFVEGIGGRPARWAAAFRARAHPFLCSIRMRPPPTPPPRRWAACTAKWASIFTCTWVPLPARAPGWWLEMSKCAGCKDVLNAQRRFENLTAFPSRADASIFTSTTFSNFHITNYALL